MAKRALWVAAALVVSVAVCRAGQVTEVAGETLTIGKPFPAILWKGISEADAAYLGISGGEGGTGSIPGEILLVEFFNAHCASCMAQAPVMVELQKAIDADEEIAGKARLLGVAEGNTPEEVEEFRSDYRISFPLISDPRFQAYHTFGNPGGTPYTVLCVKRDGEWIVATTHLGAITTAMLPYFEMKRYRNLDASLFAGLAEQTMGFQVVRKPPVLRMEESELTRRILGLETFEGKDAKIEPLDLPQTGRVYRVEVPGGPYFARLFSVAPVCDICHALHFVGVFDRYGEVVDLLKIFISRYGNQEITDEEVDFLRGRLKGFSAFRPRMFNPSVDAVSGATMSSSLVFDAMARAGSVFQDLIDQGHVSP